MKLQSSKSLWNELLVSVFSSDRIHRLAWRWLMLSVTQNLKETPLNSMAIFTYFVSNISSISALFSLISISALSCLTAEESTFCTVLAQLLLLDCSFWSSAVTTQARIRQFRISLLPFECIRPGALVQSSVCPLIPSAALPFRCSLYFPELSGCDTDPCSLSTLVFVSINTKGTYNVV